MIVQSQGKDKMTTFKLAANNLAHQWQTFGRPLESYTLAEARKALKNIFIHDDLCEGDDNPSCRKALTLLTLHPQLAKEWYEATDEDAEGLDVSFRFLPLSIFVASGASLDAVEAVIAAHSPSVEMRAGTNDCKARESRVSNALE